MTAHQPDGTPAPNPDQPQRRNPLFLIIVILVGGVVPLLGIAYFIFVAFGSLGNISGLNTGHTLQGPLSRPLSGNPGRFDPLFALPEVADFAGIREPVELISFSAYYVRSDGTMDLNAPYTPAPHIEYLFLHELVPATTPGSEEAAPQYELVTVEIYHPGEEREATEVIDGETVTYTYGNEGMIRYTQPPTESPDVTVAPQPACGLYQLWAVAVTQGVPQDGVAVIEYNADGYTFTFGETTVLSFGPDCALRE